MKGGDLLAIVEKCGSLEELSIASCYEMTSEGLGKALPFLKNLRKLDLWELENLNDRCFHAIAKLCPLLEDLNLRETLVMRDGVTTILKFATNLKFLNLSQCSSLHKTALEAIMKEKPPHLEITAIIDEEIYGFPFDTGSDADDYALSDDDYDWYRHGREYYYVD
ncbi:hypothetical protein DFS34DRAFT_627469 [Phlyctochytrium arcticum]|nr:hypothetical protein DFS34DRAFT_627469 [Phlyctochytrium arcticum]